MNLAINLNSKYSRHLLTLPEPQIRRKLAHALEQLTNFHTLAEAEINQEEPLFGKILYSHLINIGIAAQTNGCVHLTQRGKDLIFILACYLDATITE